MSAKKSLMHSVIFYVTFMSIAVFFVLDLLTPNGYASGALYLSSLFMALLAPKIRVSVMAVLLINILIVGVFFISPMSAEVDFFKEAINRMVVMLLTWVVAIIGWQFKRNYAKRLFLAAIVDSSEDAIVGINLKGKITSWNQSAERLIGYSFKEVKRKSIFRFLIDEDDYHHQRLLEAMEDGISLDYHELILYRKSGGQFYASLSMAPIEDALDNVIGFSLIIRDTSHLKQIEREKDDYRQQLEKEVDVRTQELVDVNHRLQQLAAYTNKAIEAERANLAREVHDHLGQLLTALKMDVSAVQRKLDGTQDDAITKRFDAMGQLIDELVVSVQKVVSQLRPSILDDLGLIPAIEWQLKEFKRRSDIECFFVCKIKDVDRLDVQDDPAIAVFRIFQEALTNVARHAEAQSVMVYIAKVDGYLQMAVKDDGKGADQRALRSGKSFGLIGMKERIAVFDGHVDITSEIGQGTTVSVFLPEKYIQLKSEV